MKKRYTVTFHPKLLNIDHTLQQIERLGIEVESAQRFIGTAVVSAEPEQLEKVRKMDAIKGITETRLFHAM